MRDWVYGSDEWQSIAYKTDGKLYNVPEGIMFSFPCTTTPGKYTPVTGLDIDDEISQARIKKTTDELLSERAAVDYKTKKNYDFLKNGSLLELQKIQGQ
jgi:malate dehydrogenase